MACPQAPGPSELITFPTLLLSPSRTGGFLENVSWGVSLITANKTCRILGPASCGGSGKFTDTEGFGYTWGSQITGPFQNFWGGSVGISIFWMRTQKLTVPLCSWQGEIGEPGQKGSKGDKGEQVSAPGIASSCSLEERVVMLCGLLETENGIVLTSSCHSFLFSFASSNTHVVLKKKNSA